MVWLALSSNDEKQQPPVNAKCSSSVLIAIEDTAKTVDNFATYVIYFSTVVTEVSVGLAVSLSAQRPLCKHQEMSCTHSSADTAITPKTVTSVMQSAAQAFLKLLWTVLSL